MPSAPAGAAAPRPAWTLGSMFFSKMIFNTDAWALKTKVCSLVWNKTQVVLVWKLGTQRGVFLNSESFAHRGFEGRESSEELLAVASVRMESENCREAGPIRFSLHRKQSPVSSQLPICKQLGASTLLPFAEPQCEVKSKN